MPPNGAQQRHRASIQRLDANEYHIDEESANTALEYFNNDIDENGARLEREECTQHTVGPVLRGHGLSRDSEPLSDQHPCYECQRRGCSAEPTMMDSALQPDGSVCVGTPSSESVFHRRQRVSKTRCRDARIAAGVEPLPNGEHYLCEEHLQHLLAQLLYLRLPLKVRDWLLRGCCLACAYACAGEEAPAPGHEPAPRLNPGQAEDLRVSLVPMMQELLYPPGVSEEALADAQFGNEVPVLDAESGGQGLARLPLRGRNWCNECGCNPAVYLYKLSQDLRSPRTLCPACWVARRDAQARAREAQAQAQGPGQLEGGGGEQEPAGRPGAQQATKKVARTGGGGAGNACEALDPFAMELYCCLRPEMLYRLQIMFPRPAPATHAAQPPQHAPEQPPPAQPQEQAQEDQSPPSPEPQSQGPATQPAGAGGVLAPEVAGAVPLRHDVDGSVAGIDADATAVAAGSSRTVLAPSATQQGVARGATAAASGELGDTVRAVQEAEVARKRSSGQRMRSVSLLHAPDTNEQRAVRNGGKQQLDSGQQEVHGAAPGRPLLQLAPAGDGCSEQLRGAAAPQQSRAGQELWPGLAQHYHQHQRPLQPAYPPFPRPQALHTQLLPLQQQQQQQQQEQPVASHQDNEVTDVVDRYGNAVSRRLPSSGACVQQGAQGWGLPDTGMRRSASALQDPPSQPWGTRVVRTLSDSGLHLQIISQGSAADWRGTDPQPERPRAGQQQEAGGGAPWAQGLDLVEAGPSSGAQPWPQHLNPHPHSHPYQQPNLSLQLPPAQPQPWSQPGSLADDAAWRKQFPSLRQSQMQSSAAVSQLPPPPQQQQQQQQQQGQGQQQQQQGQQGQVQGQQQQGQAQHHRMHRAAFTVQQAQPQSPLHHPQPPQPLEQLQPSHYRQLTQAQLQLQQRQYPEHQQPPAHRPRQPQVLVHPKSMGEQQWHKPPPPPPHLGQPGLFPRPQLLPRPELQDAGWARPTGLEQRSCAQLQTPDQYQSLPYQHPDQQQQQQQQHETEWQQQLVDPHPHPLPEPWRNDGDPWRRPTSGSPAAAAATGCCTGGPVCGVRACGLGSACSSRDCDAAAPVTGAAVGVPARPSTSTTPVMLPPAPPSPPSPPPAVPQGGTPTTISASPASPPPPLPPPPTSHAAAQPVAAQAPRTASAAAPSSSGLTDEARDLFPSSGGPQLCSSRYNTRITLPGQHAALKMRLPPPPAPQALPDQGPAGGGGGGTGGSASSRKDAPAWHDFTPAFAEVPYFEGALTRCAPQIAPSRSGAGAGAAGASTSTSTATAAAAAGGGGGPNGHPHLVEEDYAYMVRKEALLRLPVAKQRELFALVNDHNARGGLVVFSGPMGHVHDPHDALSDLLGAMRACEQAIREQVPRGGARPRGQPAQHGGDSAASAGGAGAGGSGAGSAAPSTPKGPFPWTISGYDFDNSRVGTPSSRWCSRSPGRRPPCSCDSPATSRATTVGPAPEAPQAMRAAGTAADAAPASAAAPPAPSQHHSYGPVQLCCMDMAHRCEFRMGTTPVSAAFTPFAGKHSPREDVNHDHQVTPTLLLEYMVGMLAKYGVQNDPRVREVLAQCAALTTPPPPPPPPAAAVAQTPAAPPAPSPALPGSASAKELLSRARDRTPHRKLESMVTAFVAGCRALQTGQKRTAAVAALQGREAAAKRGPAVAGRATGAGTSAGDAAAAAAAAAAHRADEGAEGGHRASVRLHRQRPRPGNDDGDGTSDQEDDNDDGGGAAAAAAVGGPAVPVGLKVPVYPLTADDTLFMTSGELMRLAHRVLVLHGPPWLRDVLHGRMNDALDFGTCRPADGGLGVFAHFANLLLRPLLARELATHTHVDRSQPATLMSFAAPFAVPGRLDKALHTLAAGLSDQRNTHWLQARNLREQWQLQHPTGMTAAAASAAAKAAAADAGPDSAGKVAAPGAGTTTGFGAGPSQPVLNASPDRVSRRGSVWVVVPGCRLHQLAHAFQLKKGTKKGWARNHNGFFSTKYGRDLDFLISACWSRRVPFHVVYHCEGDLMLPGMAAAHAVMPLHCASMKVSQDFLAPAGPALRLLWEADRLRQEHHLHWAVRRARESKAEQPPRALLPPPAAAPGAPPEREGTLAEAGAQPAAAAAAVARGQQAGGEAQVAVSTAELARHAALARGEPREEVGQDGPAAAGLVEPRRAVHARPAGRQEERQLDAASGPGPGVAPAGQEHQAEATALEPQAGPQVEPVEMVGEAEPQAQVEVEVEMEVEPQADPEVAGDADPVVEHGAPAEHGSVGGPGGDVGSGEDLDLTLESHEEARPDPQVEAYGGVLGNGQSPPTAPLEAGGSAQDQGQEQGQAEEQEQERHPTHSPEHSSGGVRHPIPHRDEVEAGESHGGAGAAPPKCQDPSTGATLPGLPQAEDSRSPPAPRTEDRAEHHQRDEDTQGDVGAGCAVAELGPPLPPPAQSPAAADAAASGGDAATVAGTSDGLGSDDADTAAATAARAAGAASDGECGGGGALPGPPGSVEVRVVEVSEDAEELRHQELSSGSTVLQPAGPAEPVASCSPSPRPSPQPLWPPALEAGAAVERLEGAAGAVLSGVDGCGQGEAAVMSGATEAPAADGGGSVPQRTCGAEGERQHAAGSPGPDGDCQLTTSQQAVAQPESSARAAPELMAPTSPAAAAGCGEAPCPAAAPPAAKTPAAGAPRTDAAAPPAVEAPSVGAPCPAAALSAAKASAAGVLCTDAAAPPAVEVPSVGAPCAAAAPPAVEAPAAAVPRTDAAGNPTATLTTTTATNSITPPAASISEPLTVEALPAGALYPEAVAAPVPPAPVQPGETPAAQPAIPETVVSEASDSTGAAVPAVAMVPHTEAPSPVAATAAPTASPGSVAAVPPPSPALTVTRVTSAAMSPAASAPAGAVTTPRGCVPAVAPYQGCHASDEEEQEEEQDGGRPSGVVVIDRTTPTHVSEQGDAALGEAPEHEEGSDPQHQPQEASKESAAEPDLSGDALAEPEGPEAAATVPGLAVMAQPLAAAATAGNSAVALGDGPAFALGTEEAAPAVAAEAVSEGQPQARAVQAVAEAQREPAVAGGGDQERQQQQQQQQEEAEAAGFAAPCSGCEAGDAPCGVAPGTAPDRAEVSGVGTAQPGRSTVEGSGAEGGGLHAGGDDAHPAKVTAAAGNVLAEPAAAETAAPVPDTVVAAAEAAAPVPDTVVAAAEAALGEPGAKAEAAPAAADMTAVEPAADAAVTSAPQPVPAPAAEAVAALPEIAVAEADLGCSEVLSAEIYDPADPLGQVSSAADAPASPPVPDQQPATVAPTTQTDGAERPPDAVTQQQPATVALAAMGSVVEPPAAPPAAGGVPGPSEAASRPSDAAPGPHVQPPAAGQVPDLRGAAPATEDAGPCVAVVAAGSAAEVEPATAAAAVAGLGAGLSGGTGDTVQDTAMSDADVDCPDSPYAHMGGEAERPSATADQTDYVGVHMLLFTMGRCTPGDGLHAAAAAATEAATVRGAPQRQRYGKLTSLTRTAPPGGRSAPPTLPQAAGPSARHTGKHHSRDFDGPQLTGSGGPRQSVLSRKTLARPVARSGPLPMEVDGGTELGPSDSILTAARGGGAQGGRRQSSAAAAAAAASMATVVAAEAAQAGSEGHRRVDRSAGPTGRLPPRAPRQPQGQPSGQRAARRSAIGGGDAGSGDELAEERGGDMEDDDEDEENLPLAVLTSAVKARSSAGTARPAKPSVLAQGQHQQHQQHQLQRPPLPPSKRAKALDAAGGSAAAISRETMPSGQDGPHGPVAAAAASAPAAAGMRASNAAAAAAAAAGSQRKRSVASAHGGRSASASKAARGPAAADVGDGRPKPKGKAGKAGQGKARAKGKAAAAAAGGGGDGEAGGAAAAAEEEAAAVQSEAVFALSNARDAFLTQSILVGLALAVSYTRCDQELRRLRRVRQAEREAAEAAAASVDAAGAEVWEF